MGKKLLQAMQRAANAKCLFEHVVFLVASEVKYQDFMPLHTETLPNVLYFKQQESAGVMVRSEDPAFSSRGYKLPLVFIEEEMKINSKVYQKMLQRYVLPCKDCLLETIDVTITEHMRCAIQCYRRHLLVKRTWI